MELLVFTFLDQKLLRSISNGAMADRNENRSSVRQAPSVLRHLDTLSAAKHGLQLHGRVQTKEKLAGKPSSLRRYNPRIPLPPNSRPCRIIYRHHIRVTAQPLPQARNRYPMYRLRQVKHHRMRQNKNLPARMESMCSQVARRWGHIREYESGRYPSNTGVMVPIDLPHG